MNRFTLTLFLGLCICGIACVTSHSWLNCADYQATLSATEQDYSDDNCYGYIRGQSASNNPTSLSLGSNKFSRGTVECQATIGSPISSQYTDDLPYATYTPGSTYRLVWPAKNHALGEECGKTRSTDKAMSVYVNPQVNATTDLTDISDYTLVYDWHAESGEDFSSGTAINGIPFANCMDFCSDTDASPCWGDLPIPDDMFTESGFYTFLWYWEFSNLITTCFDVFIDVGGEIVTVTDDTDNETPAPIDLSQVTWDIESPVCYDGGVYDEDFILTTFEDAFEGTDFEMGSVNNVHATKDAYNITVKSDAVSTGVVTSFNNGSACDILVAAYGTGTCTTECLEGMASSLNLESNEDNNDGSGFIIALIIVLLIIGLIIGAAIGYTKWQEKVSNDNNVNRSGVNKSIASTTTDATTQQNIVTA